MKPLEVPAYVERLAKLLSLSDNELEEIHRADPTALAFLSHLGDRTADQLRELADVLDALSDDARNLLRALPTTCH